MTDTEYIIINKASLQKRINELIEQQKEFTSNHPDDVSNFDFLQREINLLEKVLLHSIPLIPEIEKAHTVGTNYGCFLQSSNCSISDNIDSEDYIKSLKFDI